MDGNILSWRFLGFGFYGDENDSWGKYGDVKLNDVCCEFCVSKAEWWEVTLI